MDLKWQKPSDGAGQGSGERKRSKSLMPSLFLFLSAALPASEDDDRFVVAPPNPKHRMLAHSPAPQRSALPSFKTCPHPPPLFDRSRAAEKHPKFVKHSLPCRSTIRCFLRASKGRSKTISFSFLPPFPSISRLPSPSVPSVQAGG